MDMKYTMKKVYALLLTIVMLVNIFPVSAFAAGPDEVRVGAFNLSNTKASGDAYHTAHIVLPSDADTTNLYLVFLQTLDKGNNWGFNIQPVTGSGDYITGTFYAYYPETFEYSEKLDRETVQIPGQPLVRELTCSYFLGAFY